MVPKIWGRRDIPNCFGPVGAADEPIGEVWFEELDAPAGELLVKFLFTSEKLSVQVHPSDDLARQQGHPHGKDEAWIILDAEPGAAIALGPREPVSKAELARAVTAGTIERLLDWREVQAGEAIYSPSGTIHAIGAGISLVEIQQNLDLTYRLYDYGRPRDLHVEEALEAADLLPFADLRPRQLGPGRTMVADGPAFKVEKIRGPACTVLSAEGPLPLLLVPLRGTAFADGVGMTFGGVWRAAPPVELRLEGEAEMLIAYPNRGELIATFANAAAANAPDALH